MKKILLKIIIVIVACLLTTNKVNAFDFVKTSDNPLPVSYINNYTSQLQANIFKEGNVYKGIFIINRPPENYYSLGYFESVNGINWQMKKEILNTGEDLSTPRIIKLNDSTIRLYFAKFETNGIYKQYSVDCDTNYNCSNPTLVLEPTYSWETKGTFAAYPFLQNNNSFLFYGAWGDTGFRINLATLLNGVWQKCTIGIIQTADGPFVYEENGTTYLFFHSSLDPHSIGYITTSEPISCSTHWSNPTFVLYPEKPYDQKHLVFPSVLNDNGGLKLYYTGLGNDSRWKLNLACTGQACLSPTPTPIPEKIPLVIIPGLMASWNRDAILHNKTVSYDDWKLLSFVKDYGGFINTLKTISYQENNNLFLFPYDWRQPIEKTTDDLNNFLQEKIWNSKPNQKVNLIGHSLGGLVARIFAQKNPNKVNKIISIGSPHLGAVQVYKPLEAGEIDRENTFLWLAEKIILILNKSTVESDRVTIANKFPVVKDLFPTFNFLKDSSGNEILIENMSTKNSLLSSYNQNFSEIFPIFTAIFGEKDKNTPSGFTIESPSSINQLLGNYKDGQPKITNYDLGDYTVLSKSASQDTDSEKLNFDHGEIITKKDAIKKILSLLNINFSDDQIVEGQATKISSSLIFLIKSPATMTVEFNNNKYIEEEGIIFIPDAQSGSYDLKVQGVDQGKYEVIVGQISENNDLWEKIEGEIVQSPPSSQTDNYAINYDNQTAFSIFPTPICTGQACLTPTMTPSPTIIPIVTSIPTGQINLSPTATPTPNLISQSTNSSPEVLGISSRQEELITPTIAVTKQTEAKREIKKSSIWNYIWPSLTSLILGGIGYLFRKKIFKK